MANFHLKVLGQKPELCDQIDVVAARMEKHDLPTYPTMVDNLMSSRPTQAEELLHACVGLAGEAGEVLDIAKKVWAYDKPLDVVKLLEELGDVRYYYQAALNFLGVSDMDIKLLNMHKLDKRFPSGKFNAADAIARADKQVADGNGSFAPAGKPEQPVRKFLGQTATVDKPVERCGHGQDPQTCTHRTHADACTEKKGPPPRPPGHHPVA